MSILGNRYFNWEILEENGMYVTCKCDCGLIKKMNRAPFLGGYNSKMCFKCFKNREVKFSVCRQRTVNVPIK